MSQNLNKQEKRIASLQSLNDNLSQNNRHLSLCNDQKTFAVEELESQCMNLGKTVEELESELKIANIQISMISQERDIFEKNCQLFLSSIEIKEKGEIELYDKIHELEMINTRLSMDIQEKDHNIRLYQYEKEVLSQNYQEELKNKEATKKFYDELLEESNERYRILIKDYEKIRFEKIEIQELNNKQRSENEEIQLKSNEFEFRYKEYLENFNLQNQFLWKTRKDLKFLQEENLNLQSQNCGEISNLKLKYDETLNLLNQKEKELSELSNLFENTKNKYEKDINSLNSKIVKESEIEKYFQFYDLEKRMKEYPNPQQFFQELQKAFIIGKIKYVNAQQAFDNLVNALEKKYKIIKEKTDEWNELQKKYDINIEQLKYYQKISIEKEKESKELSQKLKDQIEIYNQIKIDNDFLLNNTKNILIENKELRKIIFDFSPEKAAYKFNGQNEGEFKNIEDLIIENQKLRKKLQEIGLHAFRNL